MAAPARGKVDDLDLTALAVAQDRAQDRGIGQVVLFAAFEIFQLDAEVAAYLLGGREQGAERRVAIEGGQAAPDHVGLLVDQRAEAAVADDAKVEGGFIHPCVPVIA